MNIDINAIISFLLSSEVQERLFVVRVAFLSVAGIFLGVIIFCLLRSHWLQWLFFRDVVEFFTYRPFGAKRIMRPWRRILKRIERATEAESKLAVIEADDMMNNTLARMGYSGKTLEERLGQITSATLPNINQIYEAHKVRNNIVRDPDFRLSVDDAKKTLEIYEKAFRDMEMI